jgi:hypothetical protein
MSCVNNDIYTQRPGDFNLDSATIFMKAMKPRLLDCGQGTMPYRNHCMLAALSGGIALQLAAGVRNVPEDLDEDNTKWLELRKFLRPNPEEKQIEMFQINDLHKLAVMLEINISVYEPASSQFSTHFPTIRGGIEAFKNSIRVNLFLCNSHYYTLYGDYEMRLLEAVEPSRRVEFTPKQFGNNEICLYDEYHAALLGECAIVDGRPYSDVGGMFNYPPQFSTTPIKEFFPRSHAWDCYEVEERVEPTIDRKNYNYANLEFDYNDEDEDVNLAIQNSLLSQQDDLDLQAVLELSKLCI